MKKQLKGKIFWIEDDFGYIGGIIPKDNTTSHTVARIENVIIEEYMIKFFVCPHPDHSKTEWSYNVNLLVDDTGIKFNGTFSEATEPSHTGEVFAELFQNKNKYMLLGKWLENESFFTFWALFEKE